MNVITAGVNCVKQMSEIIHVRCSSFSECQYTCTERGSTVRQSVSTTKKPPAAHDDDARTRKQVSLSVSTLILRVHVMLLNDIDLLKYSHGFSKRTTLVRINFYR